ncbi:MAG TPA: hypothetical protein VGY58_00280 [Gemmataceae bacterium]|nr:hypothetical protein [Gemmataceae bacterium]
MIHAELWATFYWLSDVVLFKRLVLAAVLLNVACFYWFLSRQASRDFAALCALLLPGLIQFRIFLDPVLAFNGQLEVLMLATLLSLHLFGRFLQRGGWISYAGSLLFYLLTVLTYEMCYPFWCLHLWMLLRNPPAWKRGVLIMLAFALAGTAPVAGTVLLRKMVVPHYRVAGAWDCYDARVGWKPVCETFAKQFVAGLPTSYASLDDYAISRQSRSSSTLWGHAWVLLLSGAAVLPLAIRVAREPFLNRRSLGWFAGFGLLFMVLPVPLLALAKKYQLELQWGWGHLPVYVEYFGVALVLASAFRYSVLLCRRFSWSPYPVALTAAALFGLVAELHYTANTSIVRAARVPFLSPRREIEEALDASLLEGVSADSSLLVDAYPWDGLGASRYFYCAHLGTRLSDSIPSQGNYRRTFEAHARLRDDQLTGPNTIRVRYVAPAEPAGFILVGQVHQVRTNAAGDVCVSALTPARLAVRRAHKAANAPFVLHGFVLKPSTGLQPSSEPWQLSFMQMQLICRTPRWDIYDLPRDGTTVEGESVCLERMASGR